MLYMDKVIVQMGTSKILDGTATNSQIKQKFGSLDVHSVVDNHITNLTYDTYYSASTSSSVSYQLNAMIGGVNADVVVSGKDFGELLKNDTLINGVFQGEYFLIIKGSSYKVIKSTDENISHYKQKTEEIKQKEVAKETDTKQKVKELKQQFKQYKNPTLLKINDLTYGIYLGNIPYWTYADKEFTQNKKRQLMLVYKYNNTSDTVSRYYASDENLELSVIRWEKIQKAEFVREYTWDDIYELLSYKSGFNLNSEGVYKFDGKGVDSKYHKVRPIYLYTLLTKDFTDVQEARKLYNDMYLGRYIDEVRTYHSRGTANKMVDFEPELMSKWGSYY